MSTPDASRSHGRQSPEYQLGIDLRDRGDRMTAAIEAFTRAATLLLRFVKVGLVLFLLVYVFNGLQLWEMNSALKTGQDTRDRIIDCVEPTGQCFKEGQARTGQAVNSINEESIIAAACASDYVGLPLSKRILAIRKCVADHTTSGK